MFHVSLSLLLFVYLFGFLAVVFLAWLRFEWIRKARERRARLYRLRCTMCGCEYEDRTTELLPRCPRCGSLNERYRLRRL